MLRPEGRIPDSAAFLGSDYESVAERTRRNHNTLTNAEFSLIYGACAIGLYNFGAAAYLTVTDHEPSQSSVHIFAGLLNATAAGVALLRNSYDTHY